MALSWLKSAGIMQMIGYTVDTGYGYGGWGVLRYFMNMGGIYNLGQSYFANLQILIHMMETSQNKKVVSGCIYDIPGVAFYGDPAWDARLLTPQQANIVPHAFQLIIIHDEKESPFIWKLKVTTLISGNWTCQESTTDPGRPPFFIFPRRLKNPTLLEGEKLILTDLFAIFDFEGHFDAGFEAEVVILK